MPYKAFDKDPETRVFLKEVLGGFWKSGSLPDGEIPAGSAPAVEPTLSLWRERGEVVADQLSAGQPEAGRV